LPTEFASLPPLVGRERDIAYVRALLHEAALGTGAASFFAGVEGCGKSRFLRECAGIKASMQLLSARCNSVAIPGQEVHAQFAEQLNISSRRTGREPAERVYSALSEVVKDRPIAAFVDDLHLGSDADIAMLDALVFLASRSRFVLVACLADGATRASAALSARLRLWVSAGARCRDLAPLDDDAMTLLVRGLLHERGVGIEGAILGEIIHVAQGSPRFAIELAQQTKTTTSLADLVPPSAQAKLDALRSTLGIEEFDALALCSAVGEQFRDRWILRVSQKPGEVVAAALQAACDADVLVEEANSPGWFSFRFRSVRRAIYRSIVSLRRRALHERIVDCLTDGEPEVLHSVMLAQQWAALQNRPLAAEWYARAGDGYMASGRFSDAASQYREAVDRVAMGSQSWFALSELLLQCYRRLGEHDAIIPLVQSICDRADLSAHPEFASAALIQLFYAHLNNGDREAARNVIERMQSLRCLDEEGTADLAMVVLAYAFHVGGQRDEAARLMTGIDPERLRTDEARFRYMFTSAILDVDSEPLDDLTRRIEAAATFGRQVGNGAPVHAYDGGAYIAMCKGDLGAAKAFGEKATAAARKCVSSSFRHEATKTRALVHLLAGDLADVRRLLLSNLDWRDAGRYNEANLAGVGVFLGIRTADVSLIDALFEPTLLTQAIAVREAELCGLLLTGFAEVMIVRGMTAQLHDAIRECLDQRLVDPYAWIHVSAARYGPTDYLGHAAHQIATHFPESKGGIAVAHSALFHAIAARRRGQLTASHEHARRAALMYSKLQWRLSQALALELADNPRRAMAVYANCGATADVSRVAAAQTRKLKRSPFGARLTQREREISSLLARRRSDKEIAHVLQISVRTVHHHVESILSKLGASDRSKVTDALLNERLPLQI
jgi:DNA-binding CsgD family transcriptional regulator/tetratricopeptide (TPR) repeat protein